MRVTKEVAADNRRKILDTATRLFKTRGFDDVSLADLTRAAGFTHGGFYNHFGSKADLAVETIRHAFDEALGQITGGGADMSGAPISMADRLAGYLSADHRDAASGGCPTGSLPVDVGRQPVAAQKAFAEGLERYIELIEGTFPPDMPDKRTAAMSTLSTLVGAMVLSRAVRDGDPDLSDELLGEHQTQKHITID